MVKEPQRQNESITLQEAKQRQGQALAPRGLTLLRLVLGGEPFQPLDQRWASGQALEQRVHEAGVPQVEQAWHQPWGWEGERL